MSRSNESQVGPRPGARPRATPTATTLPYWDAAARHELCIQRCEQCSSYVFYPREFCVCCGSARLTWTNVSGRGTVHTFTIARRATHKLLTDRLPYAIVVVELDEGPRLTSTVVGVTPAQINIGMPVTVEFEDHDELSYPVFRLVGSDEAT